MLAGRIFHLLMNRKLRTKLLLSFMLMAMIPLAVYTIVTGSYYLDMLKENAGIYTKNITRQVAGNISTYIKSLENTAVYLSGRDDVNMFMSGSLDQGDSLRLERDINTLLGSRPELAGIMLATEDDRWLAAGIERNTRDSISRQPWFVDSAESSGVPIIFSTAEGRSSFLNTTANGDQLFYLVSSSVNSSSAVNGAIVLDVAHTVIEDAIKKISIYKNGFVFVYDQNQRIVYTPVNEIVYRVNPKWLSAGEPVVADIRGEKYQIESSRIDGLGWTVVGVFSVDEIQGSLSRAFNYFLIISLAFMFLFFLLFNFLTKTIVEPLINLKSLMSQAASGNFEVKFVGHYKDEVGDLGESFNTMIEEINSLIEMVYKEQHDRQQAQLRALQEQIKPHFLYNTLDTINWLARSYGAKDIVRLIDALTTMFRVGLSQGQDIITFEEELSHASNYLYIQGIRYKEKIEYEIEVPEHLYPLKVPKLILQPLIENSIYHGLKMKDERGIIKISSEIVEDVFVIRIEDDGIGIKEDELRRLNQSLSENKERDSFGLFYVNDKIKLHCGAEYGLKISGRSGGGTEIHIYLPVVKDEEDDYVQGDCS